MVRILYRDVGVEGEREGERDMISSRTTLDSNICPSCGRGDLSPVETEIEVLSKEGVVIVHSERSFDTAMKLAGIYEAEHGSEFILETTYQRPGSR